MHKHKEASTVEISVDQLGHGFIVVNGEDISDRVCGFELSARTGELTRLKIEYLDIKATINAKVVPDGDEAEITHAD